MEGVTSGCWGYLQGLQKSRHLNGQLGQVTCATPNAAGRLAVTTYERGVTVVEHKLVVGTRRYMASRKSKAIKPENLWLLPEDERTTAVRIKCFGEERPLCWEEVKFPYAHPLFFQPTNCPIPERAGLPLILTKIAVENKPATDASDSVTDSLNVPFFGPRQWWQNQPAKLLTADLVTGCASSDNQDYMGPAYVCIPGGRTNFTSQEMGFLFEYMQEKMNCYGMPDFDPSVNISPADFADARQRFVTRGDFQKEFINLSLESENI